MNVLNMLSKAKISLHLPKWLISLFILFQCGTRGVSLGVRVVILNAEGAVYLVRHSYMRGWYLPGGGVERRETALEAAKREVAEEAGIKVTGAVELHGVFLNDGYMVPDHICCYIVRDGQWAYQGRSGPEGASSNGASGDGEIVEGAFFAIDALPDGTTAATRARILEIIHQNPIDDRWVRRD